MDLDLPARIQTMGVDEFLDAINLLMDAYGKLNFTSDEVWLRKYVTKNAADCTMSIYIGPDCKDSFFIETAWFNGREDSHYTQQAMAAHQYTYDDIKKYTVSPDKVFDLFDEYFEVK